MMLPDISTLLCPWPQTINPNLSRVQYDNEMFIERYAMVFWVQVISNNGVCSVYFQWVNDATK